MSTSKGGTITQGADQHVVAPEEAHAALVDGPARTLGAGDGVGVEREALLDVPDDLGLERVALRLQHLALVGGKEGCAQNLEDVERAGEVGARLRHLHAGAG